MMRPMITWMKELAGVFTTTVRDSLSDAGTVLIFFVAVIIYPAIYSVGYLNQTIREIPVAVIDQDHTALSRQYIRMLDATEQLSVSDHPQDLQEAEELFYRGKIHGVVLIPGNFAKELMSGRQADVTVYCDAGRFFVYKQVYTGAAYANATFNAGAEIKALLARGKSMDEAVNRVEGLNAQFFELYNPSSGYATFIVPGILIIVIQQSLLVGIGLLAGKRFDRRKLMPAGTVHPRENAVTSILGRSAAFTVMYLITTLVTLVLLYHWLSFPERGNFLQVYLVLLPCLLAISFMGIAIGSWFTKRAHALMFIVFASPVVFFLTGVAWPAGSLPEPLRLLALALPTTPMIPAFIKLRIIGGGLASIRGEWITLGIQVVAWFVVAVVSMAIAEKRNKKLLPEMAE